MINDYIQMDSSIEDIEYEMKRIVREKYSRLEIAENDDAIDVISEAITGLAVKVNSNDKSTTDSLDEELYQLRVGKLPVFIRLEDNLISTIILIADVIFNAIQARIDPSPHHSIMVYNIISSVYSLYHSTKRVENNDYCVYVRCIQAQKNNEIICVGDIQSIFEQTSSCLGCKDFPIIGRCRHYREEDGGCNLSKAEILDCITTLCDNGILKPLGRDIYRFYK